MLIGLAGKARAGKSTVASFLKEKGFEEVSFAAPIRAFICDLLSVSLAELEVIKEDSHPLLGGNSPRRAMQTLGTEWGRGLSPSLWTDLCIAKMKPHNNYVISDVRFENESTAIRNAGGEMWHIMRADFETTKLTGHASEQGIAIWPVDKIVYNLKGLEDLKKSVLQLLL